MQQTVITTQNTQDTMKLGAKQASLLKSGGIVLLFGELGSGKTTFAQGFAKALGVSRIVNSPTFLIMRTYDLQGENRGKFYHLDLYRITSEKEIEELGFAEVVNNKDNFVVVEWADRLGSLVPEKRTELYFEYLEVSKRKVTIKHYD